MTSKDLSPGIRQMDVARTAGELQGAGNSPLQVESPLLQESPFRVSFLYPVNEERRSYIFANVAMHLAILAASPCANRFRRK